jgi:hypothetical protein
VKRIQRKRTKGWRMPEGAVYVGRPTKWGNPFFVDRSLRPLAKARSRSQAAWNFRHWVENERSYWFGAESAATRKRLLDGLPLLRGRNLVCWCPLDQPCHADVLLELANR